MSNGFGRKNLKLGNEGVTRNLQTLFFIGGDIWQLLGKGIFGIPFQLIDVDVASVPDKILEELITVLLVHNNAGGLDDVFDVLNEFATFGTELLLVDRGMVEYVVQRVVDLGVIR